MVSGEMVRFPAAAEGAVGDAVEAERRPFLDLDTTLTTHHLTTHPI
jgi:hypothetical protein